MAAGVYSASITTRRRRSRDGRIPVGEPDDSAGVTDLHESVRGRCEVDPSYQPKNLPEGWQGCIKPWVHADFGELES